VNTKHSSGEHKQLDELLEQNTLILHGSQDLISLEYAIPGIAMNFTEDTR
jgi:hypothetical protein